MSGGAEYRSTDYEPCRKEQIVNCHEDAAERGWELYRGSDPPVSRASINDQLRATGLDPVSDRMYRHYRRLSLHCVADYLPINELDVMLKIARRAS